MKIQLKVLLIVVILLVVMTSGCLEFKGGEILDIGRLFSPVIDFMEDLFTAFS